MVRKSAHEPQCKEPKEITGSGPLLTPTERRRHCLLTIAARMRTEAERLEALAGELE